LNTFKSIALNLIAAFAPDKSTLPSKSTRCRFAKSSISAVVLASRSFQEVRVISSIKERQQQFVVVRVPEYVTLPRARPCNVPSRTKEVICKIRTPSTPWRAFSGMANRP
jgi:hypothetical protein